MEYATGYLVGAMVLNGMFALRAPHEDCRVVFLLSLFWPLSILLILGTVALTVIGWDMDMARSPKVVYFRKPTNPALKGFAITILFQEFQFYSVKKA